MNIKGVVNNLIPLQVLKPERKTTHNTADRDPNQGGGDGAATPQRHKFTDEQLQEALKYLRENPGIKSNNLQIRVEKNDDTLVVFVEDYTGKVIRRIPESELWLLTKNREGASRGNLLNKAL